MLTGAHQFFIQVRRHFQDQRARTCRFTAEALILAVDDTGALPPQPLGQADRPGLVDGWVDGFPLPAGVVTGLGFVPDPGLTPFW